jgi:hypothetical protein
MKDAPTKCKLIKSDDIDRRLESLRQPNPVVLWRGGFKHEHKRTAWFNGLKRIYRAQGNGLPNLLQSLEEKYQERLGWQKSATSYEPLREIVMEYELSLGFEPYKIVQEGWNFMPISKFLVTDHSFDIIDADMSKSAGLPKFGSKKDNLAAGRQYVEQVVKPDPVISNLPAAFLGWRSQLAPIGEVDMRDINMIPMARWLLAREGPAKATRLMKEHWIYSDTTPTEVAFSPPERWYELFANKAPEVKMWAVFDAKHYNKSVRAEEIVYYNEITLGDWEFRPLLEEYSIYSEIQTPDGFIERKGGTLSGLQETSAQNSATNVADIVNSLGPIREHIVLIIVNGDDIVVGFKTVIDKSNINALAKSSLREFNIDKTVRDTSDTWFSKQYLSTSFRGPTKPIFLVGISVTVQERSSDPATTGKEYTAIAANAQLNYLEHHPFGDQVVKLYRSIDKYPLDDLVASSGERVYSAARKYIERNSWAVEHGRIPGDPKDLVRSAMNNWAATV